MGIISAAQKLHVDEVAQQEGLAAAQQPGDGEGGHRWDEHHGDAAEDPRQGQGKDDPAEHGAVIGAQVLGGLDDLGINLLDDGEDGQDHVGQKVVDHAQHDGPLGVDHLEGSHAEQAKEGVDQAVALQQEFPGVGPQKEVHPHGKHDEHSSHAVDPTGLPGQKVGQGVADQHADDGGDGGQQEGAAECGGVLGHVLKIGQREASSVRSEGVDRDDDQGSHHKQGHPPHIGKGNGFTLHRPPPHPR